MRYDRAYNTSRCGGTVYALVSKTSPARVEGSNLSIGISCFFASTSVHLPLYRPIECPWISTEICCCPPVLLSVLLSKKLEKIHYASLFVKIEIAEETRNKG